MAAVDNHAIFIVIGISLFSLPRMAAPQPDAVTHSFAEKMGTTDEEAARRLALRREAMEVLSQLDASIMARFAGKQFRENPTVITVRLKGNDPVMPQYVETAHDALSVVFATGASHSLEDLRAVIDAGQVQKLLPEAYGIGIDGELGEIYVDLPDEYFDAAHEQARARAIRSLGVPVQLRKSNGPARHLSSPP